MNNDRDITNYPLSWPVGWERTVPSYRERSRFGHHSMLSGARVLENELRLLGGDNYIISTNIKIRNDGLPYSNQRTPDDPGVAVYFEWKKKPIVFACDKYRSVEDNLWAIVKHIEALRGQERWGVGSLDQAFAGYMALPEPSENWWDILGVSQFATKEEIERAHILLVKQYHPDQPGGNNDQFIRVQRAYELAIGK